MRLRLQGLEFFMGCNVSKSAVIEVEVARNPLLDGCARTPLLKVVRVDCPPTILGFATGLQACAALQGRSRSLDALTILTVRVCIIRQSGIGWNRPRA